MKLETYLSYSPLFGQVSTEDSAKMFRCLLDGRSTVGKNETIVAAGELQSAVGLLVRGQAHVYARSKSGEEKYVTTLNTGDCFGLEYCLRPAPEQAEPFYWVYSLVAATECQLAFLDASRMSNPCDRDCVCHRILMQNLIRVTAQSLYRQSQRIALLTVKSMRGRILAYLLQRIEIEGEDPTTISLPFNRNRMAAYLDLSRPSMSRELASMKEEGILDYYLDTIQILNMEKLLEQAHKTS